MKFFHSEKYEEDDGVWQLRSKVPAGRRAETALLSVQAGTDVSLWLLNISERLQQINTASDVPSLLISAEDTSAAVIWV